MKSALELCRPGPKVKVKAKPSKPELGQKPRYGLQVVAEPKRKDAPSINIIFVHGLAGSPQGTWTDRSSNFFWPTSLQNVNQLSNPRILTFGYDSAWNKFWKPNTVLDVSHFAKQLLNDLKNHYFEVVVPESSATIGFPSTIEESIPVNGDHSTIVKYSNPNDPNFLMVSKTLARTISNAIRKRDGQRIRNQGVAFSDNLLFHQERSISNSENIVFEVPYDRNPNFTGRTELLDQLFRHFGERQEHHLNRRIALTGLGGVGKTQIAIEFCYRFRTNYTYIFWVSAVNQTSLLEGYQALAKNVKCELDPSTPSSPENVRVANAALKWLRSQEKCLLVIDNLDDLHVAKGYLPATDGKGHTLITTRIRDRYDIPSEGVEVHCMNSEDSVKFLLRRAEILNPTQEIIAVASRIVEELGCLPLAIEQAAGYVHEFRDISGYLELYKQNRKYLNGRKPKGINPYDNSVATTWNISIQRIEKTNADDAKLLRLLAFLNPDEILLEFLRTGSSVLPGSLAKLVINNLALHESIHRLQAYSLIRLENDGRRISMHRLVQSVIQDDLDSETQHSLITIVFKLGETCFPEWNDGANRSTCRKFRTQALGCLMHVHDSPDSLAIKGLLLLERIATYLLQDGYAFDAFRLRKAQVELLESTRGSEDPETLKARFHLASSKFTLGQAKDALAIVKETLWIQKRVLGPHHPDTLLSMGGVASAYHALGQHKEAVELHRETLEIREEVMGQNSLDTLRSMTNLGRMYGTLGEFNEGIRFAERALVVRKLEYPHTHPDTLWNMSVLVMLYQDGGYLVKAASLCEELLCIQKQLLGPEDVKTCETLGQLGWVYHSLGRNKEASIYLEQAVEIWKGCQGPDGLEVQVCSNQLASVYIQLGHLNTAVLLTSVSVPRLSQLLGPEHPDTLFGVCIRGLSFWYLNRSEEAAKLFQETYDIQHRILGPKHPATLMTQTYLALAYIGIGKAPQAKEVLDNVLATQVSTFGLANVGTMWTMHGRALALERMGSYEDAVVAYQETLRQQEHILGSEHIDTIRTLLGLGATYSEMGQPKKAIDTLVKALGTMEDVLDATHLDVVRTKENLERLRRQFGSVVR